MRFLILLSILMCSFHKINSIFTNELDDHYTLINCYHNACYVELHITNGFWLCQKRFSQGKLAWWPTSKLCTVTLRASELHILLAQGDPMKAAIPKDWRCVASYATNNDASVSS